MASGNALSWSMERGAWLGVLHLHLHGRDHDVQTMTPDRVGVAQKTRSVVRVVASSPPPPFFSSSPYVWGMCGSLCRVYRSSLTQVLYRARLAQDASALIGQWRTCVGLASSDAAQCRECEAFIEWPLVTRLCRTEPTWSSSSCVPGPVPEHPDPRPVVKARLTAASSSSSTGRKLWYDRAEMGKTLGHGK
ncbi:hypothetical protein LX36DRAFT_654745 [Colletotrichum falcatum]|nr:hypothetical protein LX36DRAFT_654745 [Colletotrichum falcatum]